MQSVPSEFFKNAERLAVRLLLEIIKSVSSDEAYTNFIIIMNHYHIIINCLLSLLLISNIIRSVWGLAVFIYVFIEGLKPSPPHRNSKRDETAYKYNDCGYNQPIFVVIYLTIKQKRVHARGLWLLTPSLSLPNNDVMAWVWRNLLLLSCKQLPTWWRVQFQVWCLTRRIGLFGTQAGKRALLLFLDDKRSLKFRDVILFRPFFLPRLKFKWTNWNL